MISHGDPPEVDENRFSLSNFTALVEAGFLTSDLGSGTIRVNAEDNTYSIRGFSVPAPFFRAFLGRSSIVFEGGARTLQFLLGCESDRSVVEIATEFWKERVETEDGQTYVDLPGIPGIVFTCDVGGNSSRGTSMRSARATYEDLYRLLEFLQKRLQRLRR